jgi:hypothetical protein
LWFTKKTKSSFYARCRMDLWYNYVQALRHRLKSYILREVSHIKCLCSVTNYSACLLLLLDSGTSTDLHLQNLDWLTIEKRATLRLWILAFTAIKMSSPLSVFTLLLGMPSASVNQIASRSSSGHHSIVRIRTRSKLEKRLFE